MAAAKPAASRVTPPPRAASRVTPARRVAYRVVRRVFEQGAFADRALHAEASGLEPRERALATALAYGTVQRMRTLDHVLGPLVQRPLERLDPDVLAALRLGCFQLLYLKGVAEHAAVNESVELVKAERRGGAGLVNAVLRRVAREGEAALAALQDANAAQAAIKHSVPDWIAELWWRELGAEEARALLAKVNDPPESAVRVNTLKAAEVELPVPYAREEELPEARVLQAPFDVFGSPLWQEGLLMPQSRASMLVSRALAPVPGERVLDLCAAPGGKTTHLGALMEGRGFLAAVEANPGRARGLAQTCARMGAELVEVHALDGRRLPAGWAPFDRVLVDPPCSGLGTLQSRPDLRWQAHRADLAGLVARQEELLRSGAAALRRGGTLVYSTCTISRAENEGVVDSLLAADSGFALESTRRLLPHRDGTDGFFIARLRRY